MQVRITWPARFLVLAGGILIALSLTHGQEKVGPAALEAGKPAVVQPLEPAVAASRAEPKPRDFSRLEPMPRQFWLSAQRGAEWLYRANGPDGRFTRGVLPALGATLGGDHYLQQVGAAAALARIATFSGEPRYAARATQAILTLLSDTTQDPRDPQVRYTSFPSSVVNRVAAAGLLVLAIHELPQPNKDLLEKSEQLCLYLRKQQQADGSLSVTEPGVKAANWEAEEISDGAGAALYGLIRSYQRQPAAWKLDVVRNAFVYYKSWFRQHKTMSFVPLHSAAYTEAFLLTKEQPFADFVFEMNDWLCSLQYQGFDDPKQVYWSGGFKSGTEGKSPESAPQATSAIYAEALAEGCRVARQLGDLSRYKTYSTALERCLAFLITLQYTETTTRHFADWYRPMLLGGFHVSHEDGNLRMDDTQHAVSAMVQYLRYVARVP
jgi:hypothetical protein